MIDAINNGDFQMLEPFLYPDSNLYLSQEEMVGYLYDNGIMVYLITFSIESAQKIGDNKFEVEAYEEIGIISGEDEEVEISQLLYTIQGENGQYWISDVQSTYIY